jgi:hypothetical protein
LQNGGFAARKVAIGTTECFEVNAHMRISVWVGLLRIGVSRSTPAAANEDACGDSLHKRSTGARLPAKIASEWLSDQRRKKYTPDRPHLSKSSIAKAK